MAENGLRMNAANNSPTESHGLGKSSARIVAPTNFMRMRQWRREFVRAGRGLQLENALQTIAALRGTHVSGRRALWALRQVHIHVRPMLDEFYVRLREQSLPLPQKTQAALGRYRTFLEDLADCYARVAYQEAERRKPSHKRMAESLYVSLQLRQEVLFIGTKVYIAPPSGFWRNVHRVYGTAEQAGVAETLVREAPRNRTARPQSAAAAYRQILAFAVAETQSLPQSQIRFVFETFAEWVAPAKLGTKPADQDSRQPLVWVDIDSDQAPELVDPQNVRRQVSALPPSARFMNLTDTVAALESLVSHERAGDPVLDPSHSLRPVTVEHLLRRFRTVHARRNDRNPGVAYVEVKSGIEEIQSALSYIVTEEHHSASVSRMDTADKAAALVESVERYTSTPGAAPEDVESTCVLDTSARGYRWPNPLNRPTHNATRSDEGKPVWTLLNESAQGLRVKCNVNRPSRIRVGQLIAYHAWDETGAATAWRLATVRWMHCPDVNLFEFGAEKIDGCPYPAVVRRPPSKAGQKENRGQEHSDPALVVHHGSAHKTTVMVPPHRYSSGEIVDLDMGTLTLPVELTAIDMVNASYAQFHYRPQKDRVRDLSAAL